MSTTTEKPTRKFPPPCWTRDEALALIEAYRERWYALRRAYLRTPDWDAVAAAVGRSCPDASPAKTSAQCRHKMEKLRQRYRAEKQRALSFPGPFFSSWFFFDSMDAMENGSSSVVGSNQQPGSGIDQNLVPPGFNSKNSNPNLGFDPDPGNGFRVKAVGDRNSVPLGFRIKNPSKLEGKSSPNFGYTVSNDYSPYLELGSYEEGDDGRDFGSGFHVKTPIDGNLGPQGFRAKKSGKIYKDLTPNFDSEGAFRVKTQIDQDSGFRPRKFSKIDGKLNPDFDWEDGAQNRIDENGEFWVKVPTDRNSVPPGYRGKYSGKGDRNSNPNFDPRVMNGFASPSRPVFGKKSGGGGGGGGGGIKRGRGPVPEIVSSIKLLGEGFVKMEKMKMEMAKEIEQMRMEIEMKRIEFLLESQQQIVDAFVKGLFENKKKVKPTGSPDS